MLNEDGLQQSVATWLRWQYPKLVWWHTPNGGSRNVIEATKLKRMGTTPGVPDIFIPSSNINFPDQNEQKGGIRPLYHGFFCELKVKPNKLTKLQKEMIHNLEGLGYYCCTCYSLIEFIGEWTSYIGKY